MQAVPGGHTKGGRSGGEITVQDEQVFSVAMHSPVTGQYFSLEPQHLQVVGLKTRVSSAESHAVTQLPLHKVNPSRHVHSQFALRCALYPVGHAE